MFSITQPVELEIIGMVPGYIAILIKAFSAIILGGIIGLDREKKLKPAGVKTQILICVGATLYTLVGMSNVVLGTTTYDPNRIAAQIVTGIGFLGAGAIIQSKGRITGMTTAASIWIVAAIGITIGSGQIFTAIFFTVIIWLTLNSISPFLNYIRPQRRFVIQVVGERDLEAQIQNYLEDIEEHEFSLEVFVHESGETEQVNLKINLSNSELKMLTQHLKSMSCVESFNSRTY